MRFFRQFQHLLPISEAWRVTLEKGLRNLFEGLSPNSADAVEFVDLAYLDLFPDVTRQLEEWEAQWGITPTGTELARRQLLAARWQALGGQSPRYLQDVLQAAGFNVFIYDWWDLFGGYTGNSVSVNPPETDPHGLTFSVDGSKMYVCGIGGQAVHEFDLSTAWDVTTKSFLQSFSVATQDTQPIAVSFKPDGLSMYVTGNSSGTIYQYDLGTAWDVSSAVFASKSFSFTTQDNLPRGTTFKPDGTKLYMVGQQNNNVYQYSVGTPWDASTISYDTVSLSVSAQDTGAGGIVYNAAGTTLYMVGASSDSVHDYALTTAFDLSSAAYVGVHVSVAAQDNIPTDIAINTLDHIFVLGAQNDSVYDYQPTPVAKDPRTHTNDPLLGNTQCGDNGSAPNTPIAECGEQPVGQISVLSATCNAFLINDVGYLVNENLTQSAPPPVPDDPATWPYFLYIASDTFPIAADIPATQRAAFEDLLLRICPTQNWIVTIVNYTGSAGGGAFAYTFAFDLPA